MGEKTKKPYFSKKRRKRKDWNEKFCFDII